MLKQMYSSAYDCLALSNELNKLGEKIRFNRANNFQDVVDGTYHSFPIINYNDYFEYRDDEVCFSYMFRKDDFLYVKLSNKSTIGHKLAALSDFYKLLKGKYGEPTLFYTTEEANICLIWSFNNYEHIINDLNVAQKIKISSLNNNTLDLPMELSSLIEKNIDEYIKYKNTNKSNSSDSEEDNIEKVKKIVKS